MISGLIYRDFLIIKTKYLSRAFLILVPVFSLAVWFLHSMATSLIDIVLPMIAASVAMNIFSDDVADGWYVLVQSLPSTPKSLVFARMCSCTLFVFIATALSSLFTVLSIICFKEYTLEIYWGFVGVGLFVSLIGLYVMLPFSYALGPSGASIAATVLACITGLAVYLLPRLNIDYEYVKQVLMHTGVIYLCIATVITVLIAGIISLAVSVTILSRFEGGR